MCVPAYKFFGYAFPFVAVDLMRLEESSLILLAPEAIIDFGIEVIVPSDWGYAYLSRHCLPVLSYSVSAHNF